MSRKIYVCIITTMHIKTKMHKPKQNSKIITILLLCEHTILKANTENN